MSGTSKTALDRRAFLLAAGGAGLTGLWPAASTRAYDTPQLTRPIPSTGEQISQIGMGSWITFNVGEDEALRNARAQVLQAFFDAGGGLIDSSPMYGSSEAVIGYGLKHVTHTRGLLAATKVWTVTGWLGRRQMEASEELWGVGPLDLIQVHNLVDWETHLETLGQWKADGRIRYVGVTTSHGRRHEELERIMATEPIDFVQFTYNIADREAEARLLPLAAERGLAVIANRPFRRGRLVDTLKRHPLPDWAYQLDARNWPQFLLKFIVSHPAVTCAIPATSRVDHMRENMEAAYGRMPDADLRRRMVRYVEAL